MARILVVDDEPDLRQALKTLLERAGHEVLEASDGAYVQDLLLLDHPDLVLMDVAMTQVSGLEALALAKSDERTRDIPVIMVTVKGGPQELQQARALGALDYINKPWGKGEVVLRTEWALKKAARQRSASAPS